MLIIGGIVSPGLKGIRRNQHQTVGDWLRRPKETQAQHVLQFLGQGGSAAIWTGLALDDIQVRPLLASIARNPVLTLFCCSFGFQRSP
jgi:hypothetical protein